MTEEATSTPDASGSPLERQVRPAVAEAVRLAEKMMRDSWADGKDAAWQPARAELLQHLETMLEIEREAAARKRTKPPRDLRPVGTGALLGEQQYCFTRGWKDGQRELRRAIREQV